MFKLIDAEVKPLTPQFAAEFRGMEASPTERELNPLRVKHLKEKAEAGQLVTFHWSVAQLGQRKLRMNGQHSSAMLCGLNGTFPEGLMVHLDTYEVDSPDGLALLFRQFDDRKSSRSPLDVSGAYQGLYEPLKQAPREMAKLAIEGHVWYQRTVEGAPVPPGDSQYELFSNPALHNYVNWIGGLITKKTPEFKRPAVVGAMYATFIRNELEARTFWDDVARGGVKFDDQAPATVLANWYKALEENPKRGAPDIKPASLYQGSIWAWNAFREGKQLTQFSRNAYDTKKGFFDVVE